MELRKDYILDRWVIIAPKRGKRPFDFKEEQEVFTGGECAFCPGNELQTPPEIGRFPENGDWRVRWFANKFGFVAKEGQQEIRTDNDYYTFSNAFGEHEVIVETPEHEKQLHNLSVQEIADVLRIYSQRIQELSKRNKYVVIFKNHGQNAGTSLFHSHTQVAAINLIPPALQQEVDLSHKDTCLYCQIIEREKSSLRRAFENEDTVAFCPYASRFNFELWLFPKRHLTALATMTDSELVSMASLLKQSLEKLSQLNADYNFCLHYAPVGTDLHLHIEIQPRIAKYGGFENSTGIIVNQLSPEDAAEFYRL
ncbi:MAG: galactose-1-phosphate uridylyltransferase [Candidatus Woesearchaeota archaeon]